MGTVQETAVGLQIPGAPRAKGWATPPWRGKEAAVLGTAFTLGCSSLQGSRGEMARPQCPRRATFLCLLHSLPAD